jgi:acetyl esterase/lipase
MLLVHGLKDDTVWPKNSRNLAAALQKLGVPVTLDLFPKLSHADTAAALSAPLRGRAPILAAIGAFIDPPGHAAAAGAGVAHAGAAQPRAEQTAAEQADARRA